MTWLPSVPVLHLNPECVKTSIFNGVSTNLKTLLPAAATILLNWQKMLGLVRQLIHSTAAPMVGLNWKRNSYFQDLLNWYWYWEKKYCYRLMNLCFITTVDLEMTAFTHHICIFPGWVKSVSLTFTGHFESCTLLMLKHVSEEQSTLKDRQTGETPLNTQMKMKVETPPQIKETQINK